jgi:predicted transcriptional regulator
MPKPKLPRPTDFEVSILHVLWKRGPSTVREVQQEIGKETGYTTVLKIMQLMAEKGLVKRDEAARTHVYSATKPAEETQKHLIRDLVDRAFNGSPMKLIMQALAAKKSSPEELAELRKMIDEVERKKK